MDLNNYEVESKEERLNRRIAKFRRELIHFRYLKEKGFHPLEIADQLNHNMFTSMRIGLENKYPDANQDEIFEKMKILIDFGKKF